MGLIIAALFLFGVFMFCALVASWFVEGSAAIFIVAILIMIALFAVAAGDKK